VEPSDLDLDSHGVAFDRGSLHGVDEGDQWGLHHLDKETVLRWARGPHHGLDAVTPERKIPYLPKSWQVEELGVALRRELSTKSEQMLTSLGLAAIDFYASLRGAA